MTAYRQQALACAAKVRVGLRLIGGFNIWFSIFLDANHIGERGLVADPAPITGPLAMVLMVWLLWRAIGWLMEGFKRD